MSEREHEMQTTEDGSGAASEVTRPVRRIVKPIILLGSGRSRTTQLGQIFSHHPDVPLASPIRLASAIGRNPIPR